MPRKLSNALTAMAVKNAKPGRHADGGGLHLLVKETGARSWVYRFMLKGRSLWALTHSAGFYPLATYSAVWSEQGAWCISRATAFQGTVAGLIQWDWQ